MAEAVTYILGAGFSAPLGLPLISNFLIRSKDLYFRDPTRYAHFEDVFEAIDRMAMVKNFFTSDLFNIEEILSILEMQSFTEGARFSETFQRYICDTIAGLTPEMPPYGPFPGNWNDFVYGKSPEWHRYGRFIGEICGFQFQLDRERGQPDTVRCVQTPSESVRYSIITLNYDRVVETIPEFIQHHYHSNTNIGFRRATEEVDGRPLLAKLHGSIEVGSVIPPTWSKGSHSHIVPEWRAALESLNTANHVRVIGYSLPIADAYVRYLFKSGVIRSRHLKTFDVIGLDSDNSVRQRFDDFVNFNYYRFSNASTESYLDHLKDKIGKVPNPVEAAHEAFMNKKTSVR